MAVISQALSEPDLIRIVTEAGTFDSTTGGYQHADIRLRCQSTAAGSLRVSLQADQTPVSMVTLRWERPMPKEGRYLADEWERGYGTMGFRGLVPNRIMPWYFAHVAGGRTSAYGVKVRPDAMCFWQVDSSGITLNMDVRSGGRGVILAGGTLKLAEVLALAYEEVDSFEAIRSFCAALCTDPLCAGGPVYGSNNWYYAYGQSSQAETLADADYLAQLSEGNAVRPFLVLDDCWQEDRRSDYNGGPWRQGNDDFPSMRALAQGISARGVRPGIWARLLLDESAAIPDEWRLAHTGCLDPTHPDALAHIAADVERFCAWGYELIKHDFSTLDLFGRYGWEMNPLVTQGGWHFHDRSRTSAQVVKDLYRTILERAQPYGTLILGCDTIGHLGAGLMHIDRVGDDTSGVSWERTRCNGINTLAFRLPQHGTFFDIDADCIGISSSIDWQLNRQWSDLLARSGTPYFFSARAHSVPAEVEGQLRVDLGRAARPQGISKPLDWELTDCPEDWESDGERRHYSWYGRAGIEFAWHSNRSMPMLSIIDE
ncbi:alpha-galactosidase [Bifidobacterium aemilianum]|uniref:Alpha-galactosidase n=1 Tax=Bifidobacterium aemilianum TaxID=2493120 RepID=A0A366K7Y1_9BIFI|nr:alpha-galactosidase [Bifidobacterium aemilianum]RBP97779.1 alpha-galactosidase [Bifidobacterium aemilianum]